MEATEKEVKKKLISSRRVVEEAIDLSKGSDESSWYELIPSANDSRASYPSACQDQVAPSDDSE